VPNLRLLGSKLVVPGVLNNLPPDYLKIQAAEKLAQLLLFLLETKEFLAFPDMSWLNFFCYNNSSRVQKIIS